MGESASVKVELPEGEEELWAPCGQCAVETAHRILTRVELRDGTPDGDIQVWEDYLTIQCGGCKSVSFCRKSGSSEDYILDHESGEYEEVVHQEVFPSRIAGRAELERAYELPAGVYEIYRETHAALCNKQQALAGMGMRAIVEAVCKQKGATGDNLQQQIESLASLKVITPEGAEILHGVRYMGNDAAHEVRRHKEVELVVAFDVVEYLLTGVYLLPARAEKLPKKGTQRR